MSTHSKLSTEFFLGDGLGNWHMESGRMAPHSRGRIRTLGDNLCPGGREKRPGVKYGPIHGSGLFNIKPIFGISGRATKLRYWTLSEKYRSRGSLMSGFFFLFPFIYFFFHKSY